MTPNKAKRLYTESSSENQEGQENNRFLRFIFKMKFHQVAYLQI